MSAPKIVSLFSGAGGLDFGFKAAEYPIAFAVDKSDWAVKTHRLNFPATHAMSADLVQLGPTGLIEELSHVLKDGERIGVIGGPPCQGFSRANRSASDDDPRNRLPVLYLEIVEQLQTKYDVAFVLFENVLGFRDRKHLDIFNGMLSRLEAMGLCGGAANLCASDFGVPQRRRRVIISAFQAHNQLAAFKPLPVESDDISVRFAIGNLPEPTFFRRGLTPADIPFHPNHWTMNPKSPKFSDNFIEMRGARSFRRLDWNQPSPTVAYGHREIHVHPSGRRRLSILEAMLLQGFPKEFVLLGPLSAQVDQISNAVPPPLAYQLAKAVSVALDVAAKFQREVDIDIAAN